MGEIFILQALFAISQVESSPTGNMGMNSNTMQRDMSNMMYYNGMYWYFDSQTQQWMPYRSYSTNGNMNGMGMMRDQMMPH
ncbi:hypothetical protein WR25_20587 [Diploscapter pachys]|uniref:WW domain-containing protein n=1 Tax=Diploscapter pachys TaxID=2018661 RepID=A0A2A2K5K6_9BILA|nr:hypothetical protein WR25_20587 [Diploscapter pachys]